jgi:hypothetical protein
LESELKKFPEQSTKDPREIVVNLCNEFLADIAGNAYFNATHLELFNAFKQRFRKLKEDLGAPKSKLDPDGESRSQKNAKGHTNGIDYPRFIGMSNH